MTIETKKPIDFSSKEKNKITIIRLSPEKIGIMLEDIFSAGFIALRRNQQAIASDKTAVGVLSPVNDHDDFLQKAALNVWRRAKRLNRQGGLPLRIQGEPTQEKILNTFAAYVAAAANNERRQQIRNERRTEHREFPELGYEYGVGVSGNDTHAGDFVNLPKKERAKVYGENRPIVEQEVLDREVRNEKQEILIRDYLILAQRHDFRDLLSICRVPYQTDMGILSSEYVRLLQAAAFLQDAYCPIVKRNRIRDAQMPIKDRIAILTYMKGEAIEKTAERLNCRVNSVHIRRTRAIKWLNKWQIENPQKDLPFLLSAVINKKTHTVFKKGIM